MIAENQAAPLSRLDGRPFGREIPLILAGLPVSVRNPLDACRENLSFGTLTLEEMLDPIREPLGLAGIPIGPIAYRECELETAHTSAMTRKRRIAGDRPGKCLLQRHKVVFAVHSNPRCALLSGFIAQSELAFGFRRGGWRRDISCPGLHQFSPFFQRIAAAISAFGLITDHVRKCSFRELARKGGAFAGPIAE